MQRNYINSGRRHENRRRTLGGFLTAIAVMLASLPVLAAEVVESATGSAYGVAAQVTVLGVGQGIQPTPQVVLPASGDNKSQTVASLDQPSVVSTGVMTVQVSSSGLGTDNGVVSASAEVNNLSIGLPILGSVLGSTVIKAECSSGPNGPTGSTLLVGASALGQGGIAQSPAPNTTLNIAGVGTLRLNRQTTDAEGNLTVTGLSLEINALGIASGTINVARATCGTTLGDAPTTTSTSSTSTTVPTTSSTTVQPTTTTTDGTPTTTIPSTTSTTSPRQTTTTIAPNGPTTTVPGSTDTTIAEPHDDDDGDLVCEPEESASVGVVGGSGGSGDRGQGSNGATPVMFGVLLAGLALGGLVGYSARQNLFSRATARLRLWASN